MESLVQYFRRMLGISQEQLAGLLGTSSVSVNRWENGKSQPSLMAQRQIYALCKSKGMELSDEIVTSLRGETTADGMILYHGSRSGLNGPIRPTSRSRCDFGRGFYMGTDPLQPLTLICNEDKPVFYCLEVEMEGLKCLNVDIGLHWAMLIAYYRGYLDEVKDSEIYERYAHMGDGYDVISGCIANDRMYQVLTDFFEKRITDSAMIGSLSALDLGKQYVAITEKACDRIRVLSERNLSQLELMILRDRSIMRRKEGVSLAEKAALEHRRDGRYFDEILKGAELE